MLDNCKVLCTVSLTEKLDDVPYTVEEGTVYEVTSHPIDKTEKWFVIFRNGSDYKMVLFNKWAFQHKVIKFAKHKAYGDFQLPILFEQGNSYTVLTPTGYLSLMNEADIVVGNYVDWQTIECSEVRFR